MAKIQLLSVENIISRKPKFAQQKLAFRASVAYLGYDKQIDILWCGEDGAWQSLPARFLCNRGENQELWLAEIKLQQTAKKSWPGNIRFSLRYRVNGEEFWDNNYGRNYLSQADSGLQLPEGIKVLAIHSLARLSDAQKSFPVSVAVNAALKAKKVTVVWTKDNWRHSNRTPCFLKKDYWRKSAGSKAANPNQYDVEMWSGRLNFGNAFKIEYCLKCEGEQETVWDNNGGLNYLASRKPLAVMILNLHCYQEDNQDDKLSQIAKAINEKEADIICLQEVAEPWNDSEGDWNNNAARIINDRLQKPYYLYTDWSHLGFDKYREGVAILSRFPLLNPESRYVSDSDDAYSIHSRKIVMAQINLPYLGPVNVFSAHLSWWEDGFQEQFNRLSEWAQDRQTDGIKATLLCGDFNIEAGSEGYRLVVDSHSYDDQFLAASSPDVFERIFKVIDPHWQQFLAQDYRIDYIFMHKISALTVTSGTVLFTSEDYGRVFRPLRLFSNV